ncbi:MAG: winged helix-turn-helix domain-containing protein [Phycisphaerae bacterium]
MTTKKSSRKRTTGGTEKRPAKRKVITTLAEYEADAKAGGTSAPPAADVGAGAKKSAKAGRTAKGRKTAAPRKSLAGAAVLVLADAKEPMGAKAIVEAATAAGWYEPARGKTPHATLYSSMMREARDDGEEARFRKAKRGLWELTDAGKAQVAAVKEAMAAK